MPLELHRFAVSSDHFFDEIMESRFVRPTEFFMRLGWVANQQIDLGRAEIPRINLDENIAGIFIAADLVDGRAFPGNLATDFSKSELSRGHADDR